MYYCIIEEYPPVFILYPRFRGTEDDGYRFLLPEERFTVDCFAMASYNLNPKHHPEGKTPVLPYSRLWPSKLASPHLLC